MQKFDKNSADQPSPKHSYHKLVITPLSKAALIDFGVSLGPPTPTALLVAEFPPTGVPHLRGGVGVHSGFPLDDPLELLIFDVESDDYQAHLTDGVSDELVPDEEVIHEVLELLRSQEGR